MWNVSKGETVTFVMRKVGLLQTLLAKRWQDFRPVLKFGHNASWKKHDKAAELSQNTLKGPQGETTKTLLATFTVELPFDATEANPLSLAVSFPYSYDDLQKYLAGMEAKAQSNSNRLYFVRELFISSYEKHRVDIITISSHRGLENSPEQPFSEVMFPDSGGKSRANRFSNNKKVVLITARVHPGETPSSFAMEGILDLLLDPHSPIAAALRDTFVFKVVPMLNPDGVSRGNFRTDSLLHDLNRYFDTPTPELHPPAFAVGEMLDRLSSENRLGFFCDIHSHGLPRNCYLYGNHMKFSLQVEAQAFARLLELHCPTFSFADCDFTLASMGGSNHGGVAQEKIVSHGTKSGSQAKGPKKSKQGCSRVVAFKKTSLIHSFTLELGYHGLKSDKSLPQPAAGERSFFTTDTFRDVGRSLLFCLLDFTGGHPESLVASRVGSIEKLRDEVAQTLKKEYVRKERHLDAQVKNINGLILEHYEKMETRIKPSQPSGNSRSSKEVGAFRPGPIYSQPASAVSTQLQLQFRTSASNSRNVFGGSHAFIKAKSGAQDESSAPMKVQEDSQQMFKSTLLSSRPLEMNHIVVKGFRSPQNKQALVHKKNNTGGSKLTELSGALIEHNLDTCPTENGTSSRPFQIKTDPGIVAVLSKPTFEVLPPAQKLHVNQRVAPPARQEFEEHLEEQQRALVVAGRQGWIRSSHKRVAFRSHPARNHYRS